MLMLSIGFLIKQLDQEVKRNPRVVAWYSVHKLHMTTVLSKRYKCVHSKLFAVSNNFRFEFQLLVVFCEFPYYQSVKMCLFLDA